MKKFIALMFVPMAVALGGCSSDTPPTSAPAPVVQQSPQPAPQVSNDEQFLAAVRSQAPAFYSVSDDQLISLGNKICEGLVAGIPIQQILQTGINSGLSSNEVAAVAAGAVVFYCPGADA